MTIRIEVSHRQEPSHQALLDNAAALGVTASIQPVHAPGAMDFPLQPTMDKISRDRWRDAYLCRDLAQAGARLAFASDWPVTDINPFRGIQAALTRPVYEGGTEQTLSLHQILAGYTIGGAWAERDHVRADRTVPVVRRPTGSRHGRATLHAAR